MGRLSDVRERLECFPQIVEQVRTLREEMECIAAGVPHATMARLWCTYGAHAGRFLPLSLAPILDRALIQFGIAVGWHGAPPSCEVPSYLMDHDRRFLLGQLIHATKEYDGSLWTADVRDVQTIGHLAAYALASTRFGQQVDLIVSVPSSRGSNSLPYLIARDLAFLTGIQYAPADTITFGRQVSQVKQERDYWQKRELLHAAMDARPETVRDRYILLVDDVCNSGTTLHECAHACRRAGSSEVSVLAVSKSFEFQRIPAAHRSCNDLRVEVGR